MVWRHSSVCQGTGCTCPVSGHGLPLKPVQGLGQGWALTVATGAFGPSGTLLSSREARRRAGDGQWGPPLMPPSPKSWVRRGCSQGRTCLLWSLGWSSGWSWCDVAGDRGSQKRLVRQKTSATSVGAEVRSVGVACPLLRPSWCTEAPSFNPLFPFPVSCCH